jgi:hypothetical protein
MVALFYTDNYPAGREVKARDQVPVDTPVSDASGPSSTVNGDPSTDPNPTPTPTDYFVPSSALNNPQPWTTQTPGTDVAPTPSSIIVANSNLPVSGSVISSTGTLQPTPTAVPVQAGALATNSSSNKKYIIGGAVGGGVLVLILFALLLFCCCKRRGKGDLERSGGGQSEEQHGYGQFACCSHGTCNRTAGQPQTEQKTPLKPFVLRSDPVAPTPNSKERPQQHHISLNRRDSVESQGSESDTVAGSVYSSDSESTRGGKRRSQKRPPPLKLTSLVTPVINGPQNNTRRRADLPSPPSPREVPTIVVDPPRSTIPDRLKRR